MPSWPYLRGGCDGNSGTGFVVGWSAYHVCLNGFHVLLTCMGVVLLSPLPKAENSRDFMRVQEVDPLPTIIIRSQNLFSCPNLVEITVSFKLCENDLLRWKLFIDHLGSVCHFMRSSEHSTLKNDRSSRLKTGMRWNRNTSRFTQINRDAPLWLPSAINLKMDLGREE